MKLALIIDKSAAYINFQKERVLGSWGVAQEDTQLVKNLGSVGSSTLFGAAPTAILTLEDAEAVKAIVTAMEKKTSEELAESFSEGLIITTTVPRTSTKKLEAKVKALGGDLYSPPGKGDEPLAVKLLGELNLRPDVKKFVLSYVGDDYDALLPLVSSLMAIPKASHTKITEQDIYVRFPQPKGAVAPWEIEKHLFKQRNISGVIDVARRVHMHSHSLVILTVLRNKIQLAYRVATVLDANPRASKEVLAKTLNVPNNYGLTLSLDYAKKYGQKRLEKAVLILEEAEKNMKGGSAAPVTASFEASLVDLYLLFS